MPKTAQPRNRQVPAVTRAVAILRWLGSSPEPAGVNQIARELKLVPSTCLHILRVLVDEGLVSFDTRAKTYAIDIGILPIARNAIQQNDFATLVEPRLTELSLGFGGTAVATQLSGQNQMIVVALSRAPLPFRLQVDLGSRFPALISATGRCHAAYNLGEVAEADLKAQFAKLKWDRPPTFDEWKAEIEQTRDDGFAVDQGQYIGGVTILAVPVFGTDESGAGDTPRMTHSIVAIGITERLEERGIPQTAKEMLRIRDEVASQLVRG